MKAEVIGGIVLCGGRSTRMGMPKASLPFGTETMLARVVRQLASVVHPIVVVAAVDQSVPPLLEPVMLARDRHEARGPLEGIRAGLAALLTHADAAYITACDVPLLVPDVVRHMIEELGEHEIAVPYGGEFHHPLAAVYRVKVIERIEKLLESGQYRPRFLFDIARTRHVPVDELRKVDPDLVSLRNLNHPDDYFSALAACGLTAPDDVRERLMRST